MTRLLRNLAILSVVAACVLTFSSTPLRAQTPSGAAACNQATPKAITLVDVPGKPFEPIPTSDGCWIFVSLTNGTPPTSPSIAVVKRLAGNLKLVHLIPVDGHPTGMVLTHDGKLLIAADGDYADFFDAAELIAGHGKALVGRISEGEGSGNTYVNVSPDDKYVFVSDERTESITVINLEQARASGFKQDAIIGKIPVARAPIAMEFSADGKYLFATSEVALPAYRWPPACTPEGRNSGQSGPDWPQGVIHIVDLARAKTDPANSVIGKLPAGCSTVRLVLSPRGDIAYVTARNSNAVLAFDAAKLVSDPEHALIGKVPVGTAPVGVAVIDGGRRVVATNSNRFAGGQDDKQFLSVIDATKFSEGAAAVLGTIPAGAFPRELRVTADGKTLLLTNFNSSTLEVVDLDHIPLQSVPKTN